MHENSRNEFSQDSDAEHSKIKDAENAADESQDSVSAENTADEQQAVHEPDEGALPKKSLIDSAQALSESIRQDQKDSRKHRSQPASLYETTKILLFKEEKKSRGKKKTDQKEHSKPKKKRRGILRRLTYKGWILVVAVFSLILVGLFLYINRSTEIDRLSLTYLDNLSADSLGVSLQSDFADTYSVQDYTIYGESLNLYGARYQNGVRDELYGRNVLLRNIETGEQLTYTFAGGADTGIPLGQLDPGVYEIYVYDGFTPKRVYMTDEFHSDPFTTMRRDKTVYTVDLDASKDFLKKFGVETDENYLYLTVTSSLPKVRIIDVMIDPSGLVKYELSNMIENGYVSDTFNEAEQSYDFARQIQTYLEEAGLRAEISREREEASSYYGVKSRIGSGYSKQAKVFLGLSMSDSDSSLPYIMASPFSDGLLANSISYALTNSGIELQTIYSAPERLDQGVAFDTWQTGAEGETLPYTLYPQLRESGGKVTYAGLAAGSENNSGFSSNPGMYGVEFFYASTENPASQAYFENNRDLMAKSIAQGIIDYFDIPAPSEEEDQQTQ